MLPFPVPGSLSQEPDAASFASVLAQPNTEIPPPPKPKKLSIIAQLVMDHFMRQQKTNPPPRPKMPMMQPMAQSPMMPPQPPMGPPNGQLY